MKDFDQKIFRGAARGCHPALPRPSPCFLTTTRNIFDAPPPLCACTSLHAQMYEVRQSICVTGVNRDAVLAVKNLVAGVTSQPLPLESFHVKRRSDVADGAMLVPKVVLAAAHQPGRKFLDRKQAGDGQLDFLYDEVCKIGGNQKILTD